jgi:hypothetical protein
MDTPYTTILYSIRNKVLILLDSTKSMVDRVFGTHIFRKTFYLFGKLGGGKYEDLKYCARHLSEESANKVRSVYFTILSHGLFQIDIIQSLIKPSFVLCQYNKDAQTLIETIQAMPENKQKNQNVNAFRSNRVEEIATHNLVLDGCNATVTYKTVYDVSCFLVEDILGIKRDSPEGGNLSAVVTRAMEYKRPSHKAEMMHNGSLDAKVRSCLAHYNHPDIDGVSYSLLKIFYAHEKLKQHTANNLSSEQTASPLKKRKHISDLDDTKSKIKEILKKGQSMEAAGITNFPTRERKWFTRTFNQMKNCLESCCKNNINVFSERHPILNLTMFKKKNYYVNCKSNMYPQLLLHGHHRV